MATPTLLMPAPRAAVRGSLFVKAIALLLVLVAAVAASAYFFFSPRFAATFDEELVQRGNAMVRLLVQHQQLRLALSLQDKSQARTVAEEILHGDAEARFVLLLGSDGKVLGRAVAKDVPGDAWDFSHRDPRTGGVRDGIHVFAKDVEREGGGDEAGSLDFATDQGAAPRSKNLGTVVLGLTAAAAQARLSEQSLATLLLTAAALVVGFLLFFTSLSRRLARMASFAENLARGNLFAELEDRGRDEIGRLASALSQMSRQLATMVGRLQGAAQNLAGASNEILDSATRQRESATQQAAALAQTSAAMTSLRDDFDRAAARAQAVIDLAQKSEESSSRGKEAVQDSVAAMEEIDRHVEAIAEAIGGFVGRVNRIAEMVGAVNVVTEQSDLLAINAEIEAAKAGERARGFAVIAREVRDLAERSKESTREIRYLLRDIQNASRRTEGVIQDGLTRARAGKERSGLAGQAIVRLAEAIGESSTSAREIAASIGSQSASVGQISRAVADIDRSVSQSAEGIRELEGASKNMKDLSQTMAELVSQYNIRGARN